MDATQTGQLWPRVAADRLGAWLVAAAAGPLGRSRTTRRTWLAKALDSQDGPRVVVVKASANPFAAARATWVAGAL